MEFSRIMNLEMFLTPLLGIRGNCSKPSLSWYPLNKYLLNFFYTLDMVLSARNMTTCEHCPPEIQSDLGERQEAKQLQCSEVGKHSTGGSLS